MLRQRLNLTVGSSFYTSFRSSLQTHHLWVTLYEIWVESLRYVWSAWWLVEFYENYLFPRNKSEEIRLKVFTRCYFIETVKTRFNPELGTFDWSRFPLRALLIWELMLNHLISVIPPLLNPLQTKMCACACAKIQQFLCQFSILI